MKERRIAPGAAKARQPMAPERHDL